MAMGLLNYMKNNETLLSLPLQMEYRLGDEVEEEEEDVALPTVDADGNEITEPSEGTAVETNSETAVVDVTTSHTVRTESFPKTSLASRTTLHSISETVSEESILPETVSPSEKKIQPTDLPSKSQPVTSPKSTRNGNYCLVNHTNQRNKINSFRVIQLITSQYN